MRIPMLSRLRRLRRSGDLQKPGLPAEPEVGRYSLSAEIPGHSPDKPLWQFKLEMVSAPQGDGERLRLRAHFQANFASALGPVLSMPPPSGNPGSNLPVQRIGQWVRRVLEDPRVREVAAPLLQHDFNSWVELRASTADLAGGAGALLPETERLKALGIEPRADDSSPLAQSWAGSGGGSHPGYAQVSLLQLDKRHLPAGLAALLGARPFHLAAAIVNVIEQEPAG